MRKNGKRFQVDIVEGSWFSTVHESMSQAELKNVTTTPYTHLVYQLPHRSHICSEKSKDNHGVVGRYAREGKRFEGYLAVFHLLWFFSCFINLFSFGVIFCRNYKFIIFL